MLRQTQSKIISVKEFTNRLALFSNAIEACARSYEAVTPSASKTKRPETREGFAMLLFLPPKPKDSDLALVNNLICHRHYREILATLDAEKQHAIDSIEEAQERISKARKRVRDAEENLSSAKKATFSSESEGGAAGSAQDALREAQTRLSVRKEDLDALKQELEQLNARAKEVQAKKSICEQEFFKHDKERRSKGVAPFVDLLRRASGKDPLPLSDDDFANEPDAFDILIDYALEVKPPSTSDVSRLRTDCSNSAILGEFVSSNQVISPDFAAAGFPPCKTSFVRDTDPDFVDSIMAAAHERVTQLIAAPELALGCYESTSSRHAFLHEMFGAETESEGFQIDPHVEDVNILYEIALSDAFPVMVEEILKPAVLEGLARFGEERAQFDFTQKLNSLAYSEQKAREAYSRALDGLSANHTQAWTRRLASRRDILSFMLCVALLGARGVERFEVDLDALRQQLTAEPRRSGRQARGAETRFSLGRSIELSDELTYLIGKAPFNKNVRHVIVPAGQQPYPGLIGFAESVSRTHAQLIFVDGAWHLSDAGSSFGTGVIRSRASKEPGDEANLAVNRLLIDDESVVLRNGDVIVLVPVVLEDGSIQIDNQSGFSYRFELIG